MSVEDLGAWIQETERLLVETNRAFARVKALYFDLQNGVDEKRRDAEKAKWDKYRNIYSNGNLDLR